MLSPGGSVGCGLALNEGQPLAQGHRDTAWTSGGLRFQGIQCLLRGLARDPHMIRGCANF